MNAGKEQRLRREYQEEIDRKNRELALAKRDTAIEYHERHIRDEILTLHCPKCRAAVNFEDADRACFALTCPNESCNARICAFCMLISPNGAASHDHVAKCNLNWNKPHIFHSRAVWEECQQKRQVREIRQYLKDNIEEKLLTLQVLTKLSSISKAAKDLIPEYQ